MGWVSLGWFPLEPQLSLLLSLLPAILLLYRHWRLQALEAVVVFEFTLTGFLCSLMVPLHGAGSGLALGRAMATSPSLLFFTFFGVCVRGLGHTWQCSEVPPNCAQKLLWQAPGD